MSFRLAALFVIPLFVVACSGSDREARTAGDDERGPKLAPDRIDPQAALIPPAPPPTAPTTPAEASKRLRVIERSGNLAAAIRFADDPKVLALPSDSRRILSTRLRLLAMTREPDALRTEEELSLLEASHRLFENADAMQRVAGHIATTVAKRRQVRPLTAVERGEARKQLDRLADLAPQSVFLNDMLASFADADDDYQARLKYLKRAVALSPGDRRLRRELKEAQVQIGMEGKFKKARDQHFEVKFEGAAQERLAYTTLRLVEQAYFRVNGRLQFEPTEPITVVIYTGNQYANALGLPDWSGGGFDGKIRVRAGDIRAQKGTLKSLLEHEYTHAALHAAAGFRIPVWFHEGLAQSIAETDATKAARDKQFLIGAKQRGLLFDYATLSSSFNKIKSRAGARLAYAQSAALVAEMQRTQGDLGIAKLLRKVRKGAAFATAFKATYFKTPEAFASKWANDLR